MFYLENIGEFCHDQNAIRLIMIETSTFFCFLQYVVYLVKKENERYDRTY